MSNYRTQPPWEFLFSASRNTLHSYELSRLGHAANLRKEIASLLDQMMDESANAMVARVLLEQRERVPAAEPDAATEDAQSTSAAASEAISSAGINGNHSHFVSDNILADRLIRQQHARRRP